MLDLAKVTQKDFVMDLGSGDGVTRHRRREARARAPRHSNTTRTWSSISKRNDAESRRRRPGDLRQGPILFEVPIVPR